MKHYRTFFLSAGIGALMLGAAFGAHAQDNAVIGPPQLKDFQLQPRDQPAPEPAPRMGPPVVLRPTSPVIVSPPAQTEPRPAQPGNTLTPTPTPQQGPARIVRQPAPRAGAPAVITPVPVQPAPVATAPTVGAPPLPLPEAPADALPAPAPATAPPAAEPDAGFPWLYALPAALLGLLGLAYLLNRRRRRDDEEEVVAEAPASRLPPLPPPQPRPWLEPSLKAQRASTTLTETIVQFELDIVNTGKAPARDLRIDVKMFNAGAQQDEELSAFFRVAGRESTKCHLPGIAAGATGTIRGEVAMSREDMRAVQLDNRLLFIPVIAVNALYDWGDDRTGQTSRSWVVGRELEQPSEKMGAFRVDLGPRIWRTVGQRQHKLARRV
jgi:hypothetical protein